jgi:2-polyprenyl-3-methyl-5-hydroxy-6-metoxy-1,4-benzoquinol methylase
MKNSYDKHYLEENLFGAAYGELIEFFENYEHKGKVLDLGCGQGRDSIELAKMGYTVHGVDSSIVGLEQMERDAKKFNLNITSSCEDIYSSDIPEDFDIILLDSMFHFYKKDLDNEKDLLIKILKQSKNNSIIAIFMQKGKEREKVLKTIVEKSLEYTILEDKYIDYESYYSAKYLMYIIKKIRFIAK